MTAVTGLAEQAPRRLAISGHDRRSTKNQNKTNLTGSFMVS